MSKTIRNARRRWYHNEIFSRDGSPSNIQFRLTKRTNGKFSDEDTNNKRAMSRLARRKSKRLFVDE